MPWVRDGLPLGGAVRPADGGHPDHAGRHGAHDAVVAADRPADPRPPWAAPRRIEGAGRGAAGPPRAPAPGPASPPAATAGAAPVGQRRVVVHRLRHGRLAALGPRRRPAGAPRGRGRRRPAGPGRGVLRCPPRPRRAHRCRSRPGRAGHGRHARRRADRRRLGGLWCRDEGLRPPPRHAARQRLQCPCGRHPRVARGAPRRPSRTAPSRRADRRGAGPVPPPPRPARPPARPHRAEALRRARRARRRGPVLRRGRGLRHAPPRDGRRHPRAEAGDRSRGREPPSWPAPTPAVPFTWPLRASSFAIPSS